MLLLWLAIVFLAADQAVGCGEGFFAARGSTAAGHERRVGNDGRGVGACLFFWAQQSGTSYCQPVQLCDGILWQIAQQGSVCAVQKGALQAAQAVVTALGEQQHELQKVTGACLHSN